MAAFSAKVCDSLSAAEAIFTFLDASPPPRHSQCVHVHSSYIAQLTFMRLHSAHRFGSYFLLSFASRSAVPDPVLCGASILPFALPLTVASVASQGWPILYDVMSGWSGKYADGVSDHWLHPSSIHAPPLTPSKIIEGTQGVDDAWFNFTESLLLFFSKPAVTQLISALAGVKHLRECCCLTGCTALHRTA